MTAQVAADLRAAAEVLRRDGWTQGDYEKPSGSKCLVGAIESVTGIRGQRKQSCYFAVSRETEWGPITWNDTPGRTADEVIAALEAAAQAAEAQS